MLDKRILIPYQCRYYWDHLLFHAYLTSNGCNFGWLFGLGGYRSADKFVYYFLALNYSGEWAFILAPLYREAEHHLVDQISIKLQLLID